MTVSEKNPLLSPSKLPTGPSSKHQLDVKEQKTAVIYHIACRCCQGAALYGCKLGICGLGAGLQQEERGGRWVVVIMPVSGLAEGQEPLVQLQWVRRLTEPQQSQDAAWDIDRLEPEGSCRIGTHCQRLCYHHRLPASKGGRGKGGKEG